MTFLYLYDLKLRGTRKAYNRNKRRFYYLLNRSAIKDQPTRTKSAILVEDALEEKADNFFMKFEDCVELYKYKIREGE